MFRYFPMNYIHLKTLHLWVSKRALGTGDLCRPKDFDPMDVWIEEFYRSVDEFRCNWKLNQTLPSFQRAANWSNAIIV